MGCRHARQVSGTASSSDDNLDTTRGSTSRIRSHEDRGAMSRGDIDGEFDAEIVTEELQTGDQGLEVTVGAHHDGYGGGGLGGPGDLGLGFDVAALGADVVDDVDKGLDVGFGLVHRRRGHGDVAHLAAWFGGTLAVQVDAGVGDGEGVLGGFQVGVWLCAADDVEHDGGLADFEARGGDGEVEDGADVGVELRQRAAFDGVVAGVVDAAGDFAQEEAVVFEEEHLDAENALTVEGCDGFAGEFLGSLVDGA